MAHKRQHRRDYNEPGHAHELTFCCYQGFKFLRAERTCKWLAEAIEATRVDLNFDLWAYVFMPEHVHLIVRPRESEYDIAEIRRAIKAPVGSKAIKYLLEFPRFLRDGRTDYADFLELQNAFGLTVREGRHADFNHDNVVDLDDYELLLKNYTGEEAINLVIPGDFDGDGMLGVEDLDELTAAIHGNHFDGQFDLDGSGAVDLDDHLHWVREIKNLVRRRQPGRRIQQR